jgi:hypothetical protein
MKIKTCIQLVAAAASLFCIAATANAQATRTWVSGVGDDANPCSRTAPCKTFAGAISKTAEGGEIDVLDPGGFGTVTITKAMTIDGTHGSGFGSILNSGNIAGVIVNVTGGTHVNDAVVILRSLSIQAASQSPSGTGSSSNGINILKGNRVFVYDCHIENQGNAGIRSSLTSTSGAVFVRDTEFGNVNTAITMAATGGTAVLAADNIHVGGNTNGIVLSGGSFGIVTNSFFAQNIGGSAIQAGSGTTMTVTHCFFHSNSTAMNALAGSSIRANECELYDNSNGFAGVASSIITGGNNKLGGNAASIAPTGGSLTTQ